jgi:uncharacterized coiled-coil DUF342 family protein
MHNLITPTILYITGLTLLAILIVVLWLSVYYYWRAKEIAPYLMRLEDLLKKIAMAQNTLEETKAELRTKINEIARADKLIADGKAAEEWLSKEGTRMEALRAAIEEQKQRLQDATENAQKRQEELNNLTQQVADKNVDLKNATERKDKLDIEAAQQESKIQALDVSITEKAHKITELSATIEKLLERRGELEADINDLERRLESLREKLNEAKKELNQVTGETGDLRTKVAVLEGQANVARGVLAEADKTREMNKERWNDLDRRLVTNPANVGRVDEGKFLQQFTTLLKEHGFVFNERHLRAFHTGLKCADISPLVVLAGISGTGKSLLPELYAAALGMNFLPVAVQPRWDSPQDLFGFYNYMEGRYKATELSRLLWQFDHYNNPTANRFNEDMKLPMNLILLDEMNLARVEYYFSDLLSKLEIRHGLNPDDVESRKKAEIELESNASASNEQTRRLFVSLNNLFIGTMNEDETTQTLSDKVIDRANVIRFGRPQQLAAEPDKKAFLAACNGNRKISFASWKSWCEDDMIHNDVQNLKNIMSEMNEAMAKVGRPFGHRVDQAIKKYVGCYPGYPGEFNDALADQIEMKILPKLNGLDRQDDKFNEVINTLEGVIAGVNDRELLYAFTQASKEAADSFFKWRGVMR